MGHLRSDRRLRAGMDRLLDGADAAGIPVGIVSNALSGQVHLDWLAEHGMTDRFAVRIHSDAARVRKPNPEMIRLATARARRRPGRGLVRRRQLRPRRALRPPRRDRRQHPDGGQGHLGAALRARPPARRHRRRAATACWRCSRPPCARSRRDAERRLRRAARRRHRRRAVGARAAARGVPLGDGDRLQGRPARSRHPLRPRGRGGDPRPHPRPRPRFHHRRRGGTARREPAGSPGTSTRSTAPRTSPAASPPGASRSARSSAARSSPAPSSTRSAATSLPPTWAASG